MNSLAPFEDALADPDAAARASGAGVVGYLANTVPVELIRAHGLFARGIWGDPKDETPDALVNMEDFMDGWALSVFQRMIDGRFSHLDAVVIPRTSEPHLLLYYHLLEYRQEHPTAAVPEPILFDLLQTPFGATRRYNEGRFERLSERLSRISGEIASIREIQQEIEQAERLRDRLVQINALRTAEAPRLAGSDMMRIVRSSLVMRPQDFVAAADALLEARDPLPTLSGPRILLTGNGPDDTRLHEVIESAGGVVTGDDHSSGDWWFLCRVGSGDTLDSLRDAYQNHAPSPRSFPRSKGDERLLAAADRARPDGVIYLTWDTDDTLGFDYPTQRDLLRARDIPTLFLKMRPYDLTGHHETEVFVERFIHELSGGKAAA